MQQQAEEEDYETRAFKDSIATILSNASEFALYSISNPNVHPARLRLELMQQLSGFVVEKPLVQNSNSTNAYASNNANIEEQQQLQDTDDINGSDDDDGDNLEFEYAYDHGEQGSNNNNDDDQFFED